MTDIERTKAYFNYGIKCGVFSEFAMRYAQTAISALEKQIPKKPIKHGFDPNALISTVSYTCPVCNKHIGRDKFCKHCSQALDWGDSE